MTKQEDLLNRAVEEWNEWVENITPVVAAMQEILETCVPITTEENDMSNVMEVLLREEQEIIEILNKSAMERGQYLEAVMVLCLVTQAINDLKKLEE